MKLVAFAVGLAWLVAGCAFNGSTPNLSRFEFEQPHMGTLFKITLYAADDSYAKMASDAAFAKVAALERAMTDYDPESELMRLCASPTNVPVKLSEELFAVLDESLKIARISDGAFDPTIGPIIRQWRRARRQGVLPTSDQIVHAQKSVGWKNLTLDPSNRTATLLAPDMQLDLGGIAKGYAADAALAELKSCGVICALVAASGDIAAGDAPPGTRGWTVSVDIPGATERRSETFLLKNAAVSTSGDAEQFTVINGIRYSHIVDARTGVGLTNHLQVSVFASRAMLTDAFATTACVLGTDAGTKLIQSRSNLFALFIAPDKKTSARIVLKTAGDHNRVPGLRRR